MTNETKTKVGGIRLKLGYWAKFRALIQAFGGQPYLEQLIDREYKKIEGIDAPPKKIKRVS